MTVRSNTFIIGAPRRGTRKLYDGLGAHPQASFRTPKEPHFFDGDSGHRGVTTLPEDVAELATILERDLDHWRPSP